MIYDGVVSDNQLLQHEPKLMKTSQVSKTCEVYLYSMAKFFLRKKIGDRVINGHPWIFSNELGDSEGVYEPGDIVEVYSYNGSFVGKGYINPASQIRIRLLTRDKNEPINEAFFYNKIKDAWEYRQQIGYVEN